MNVKPHATSPRVELHLVSDTSELAPARKAIEALCLTNGLGESAAADVGLCLNEALANIIRHAYQGANKRPIVVVGEILGETPPDGNGTYRHPEVRVTIRDWGTGVNPETLPAKPRDPLVPGGIGLMCLKRMMDEVTFIPQPDGMLLSMSRRKR